MSPHCKKERRVSPQRSAAQRIKQKTVETSEKQVKRKLLKGGRRNIIVSVLWRTERSVVQCSGEQQQQPQPPPLLKENQFYYFHLNLLIILHKKKETCIPTCVCVCVCVSVCAVVVVVDAGAAGAEVAGKAETKRRQQQRNNAFSLEFFLFVNSCAYFG